MRKNLKNYTSAVSVNRTIGEIQELLSSRGAEKIMIDYADGAPVGLMFLLKVGDKSLPIKLPARVKNVKQVFIKNKRDWSGSLSSAEISQAERTAWRNIKDWIDAQLALIETEMVKFEEVFLPYVVSGNQTIFEKFENNQLQLESKS